MHDTDLEQHSDGAWIDDRVSLQLSGTFRIALRHPAPFPHHMSSPLPRVFHVSILIDSFTDRI